MEEEGDETEGSALDLAEREILEELKDDDDVEGEEFLDKDGKDTAGEHGAEEDEDEAELNVEDADDDAPSATNVTKNKKRTDKEEKTLRTTQRSMASTRRRMRTANT
ncbi:hypothetical protein STCU_10081 [Strigomonas culicis]|uniref:Uncharacterized protein n=1 Tax=Strigomonas culicis TaxID=28005 RepID=S9TNH5_9TRYP|nr:hypothetical protein STCU_10081 [Strigomonas culicis]|eukprot:EPY18279.1 hypothetical protein STCU_10081 [Strigomonas culicis]